MNHDDIHFSKEELARYNRHIIIKGFGLEAQKKLKAAKVLVIGSGGLGSPVLLYLAAAGVGNIGIVDFDVVDDSNLQRQVLFGVNDIGKLKTEAAKKRLEALNPYINIQVHNVHLTSKNALDLIEQYDVVADGSDNFPTRYLVNDATVLAGKPNVHASIFQFEGQIQSSIIGTTMACSVPTTATSTRHLLLLDSYPVALKVVFWVFFLELSEACRHWK